MIEGNEHLNFHYYSKYLNYCKSTKLENSEKLMLEKYFREELRILPEQNIDFDSPEVLMMVDLIRFSNFLS